MRLLRTLGTLFTRQDARKTFTHARICGHTQSALSFNFELESEQFRMRIGNDCGEPFFCEACIIAVARKHRCSWCGKALLPGSEATLNKKSAGKTVAETIDPETHLFIGCVRKGCRPEDALAGTLTITTDLRLTVIPHSVRQPFELDTEFILNSA